MDSSKTSLKYWNIFYAETVNSYGCMRLVLTIICTADSRGMMYVL
jgi:hypothetical protein